MLSPSLNISPNSSIAINNLAGLVESSKWAGASGAGQVFEPFWEFMSGPIHAGTGMLATLDNTFGPRAVYRACSREQDNLAPCFGLQFFGHAVDGASEVLTVTLKDVEDRALWSVELEPDQRPLIPA
jgi:alkaline phosphatase D